MEIFKWQKIKKTDKIKPHVLHLGSQVHIQFNATKVTAYLQKSDGNFAA